MELCGLPKARPIVCSDSPAFQRLHSSVRCAAESATRFPWIIHTTFEQRFYIRWCCIDPLRPPDLSGLRALRPSPAAFPTVVVVNRGKGHSEFEEKSPYVRFVAASLTRDFGYRSRVCWVPPLVLSGSNWK